MSACQPVCVVRPLSVSLVLCGMDRGICRSVCCLCKCVSLSRTGVLASDCYDGRGGFLPSSWQRRIEFFRLFVSRNNPVYVDWLIVLILRSCERVERLLDAACRDKSNNYCYCCSAHTRSNVIPRYVTFVSYLVPGRFFAHYARLRPKTPNTGR